MVQAVYLTKEMIAYVDDEDLPLVQQFRRWCATTNKERQKYYAATYLPKHLRPDGRFARVKLYLHRLIAQVKTPRLFVDHFDGDGLNCTRRNLIACSPRWNRHNAETEVGLYGFRGVTKGGLTTYRMRLFHEDKCYSAQGFKTPEEAAMAYDAKAIEIYGPFARTNAREGRLGEIPLMIDRPLLEMPF